MENSRKCLIVGLPEAGKSTYIGAFWAIEKDGNTGHKLTCTEYPSDTTYLDALKKSWLEQTKVKRSVNIEPQEIHLKLQSSSSGSSLKLHIPDFKGEVFQNILANNAMDNVNQWCDEADCVMFFIRLIDDDILQDELPHTSDNNSEQSEIFVSESAKMRIEDISEWTQNIMLLKYLLQTRIGNNKPIAICISAWDKIHTPIDSWIKKNHLFLYNFIRHNFTKVKFYGISAQGLEYRDDKLEQYQQLTEQKKRAYIFTDNVSYDITEPFDFLITQ